MKRKSAESLFLFIFFLINRTFNNTSDSSQLISFCRDLAKQTVDELLSDRILCKRVTLKFKTVNFEVLTRAKTLSSYTDSLNVITEKAVALLKHELNQDLELPALRLMGKQKNSLERTKFHFAR
jgi:nucleotidyltransferase/DNA polymerase involved in DNA repair